MKQVIALGLLVLICGCASVGNNFDSRKISDIKKGITSESDLVTMFGQPSSRGINSESGATMTWLYSEARVKGSTFIPFAGAFVGGTNVKNKTLTVCLDQAGKVSSYTYSGGDMGSSGTVQNDPESAGTNTPAVSPHGAK